MSLRPEPFVPMKLSILIPAFNPDASLVSLVETLADTPVEAIIVVNDGSRLDCDRYFKAVEGLPKVHLLRHSINLGKGAALKTGINYSLLNFPEQVGVVTADADGQHHPDDILRVAARLLANPGALILGARKFTGYVPLRSRLGNTITRVVAPLVIGQRVSDTQSGLRGIPRILLPRLLTIRSNRYDFELEMLIVCKHQSCSVVEEKIQTIYLEGNKSSHFNPVLDSMRIYFVLFRFSLLSMMTALADNTVFFVAFGVTSSILWSQICGRFVAVCFNYTAARKAVFLSNERHQTTLPKYLLLVLGSGIVSYGFIGFLRSVLPLNVMSAKILAESVIFIANFAIQRDFVFARRKAPKRATDWDAYYSSTPFAARITRKYTGAVLVSLLKRFIGQSPGGCDSIVEIGGANSFFLDKILKDIDPRIYHVVDSNEYGLNLLRHRLAHDARVVLHNQSVFKLALDVETDVAFSIGLIEHFDPPETRRAILAHFDILRPGGWAIISFPTPTLPYRVARFLCEILGRWNFPDERPLSRDEVLDVVRERGDLLYEKVLWPLVFTQRIIVVQKASG